MRCEFLHVVVVVVFVSRPRSSTFGYFNVFVSYLSYSVVFDYLLPNKVA